MLDTFDILQDIKQAIVPPTMPATKTGTVTVASPLQVAWVGESDSGAVWPKLDLYNPSLGDTCIAIEHGNTWLVVGSVNSAAESVWNNVGSAGQPAFVNSWSGASISFYKDASGIVRLRGQLTTSGHASGTASAVFSLPSGYRPGVGSYFTCASGGGAVTMQVATNGGVVYSAGTLGSFIDLATITFLAEN